jgi:drug/metabolite transporter (DMT)-like permease
VSDTESTVVIFVVLMALVMVFRVVYVLAFPWIRLAQSWARHRWSALQRWAAAEPWRAPLLAVLVGGGAFAILTAALFVNAPVTKVVLVVAVSALFQGPLRRIGEVRLPEHPMAHEWRRQHRIGRL